jgi:RNA polymerase I-specific transcription initiation factor RRN7
MSRIEFKGPPCGIENCPSTRYHYEGGRKICRRGHEHEGFQIGEEEFVVGSSQGQRTRAVKEKQEKITRVLKGRRALELFLQCYQLILWKQCHSLVHDKGFPDDLEAIVKELWGLRLQAIEKKTPKLLEADDEEARTYSSQTEGESASETDTGKAKNDKERFLPKLIDSLALCYMAMVLLRLPISIGDLCRYATSETIPFVRAIRHIPTAMRRRLPVRYINILEGGSPLKPNNLHHTIHEVMGLYNRHFDLDLPPLNHVPVLFRYIHNLALPLELVQLTQEIAGILGKEFQFLPQRHRNVTMLPELQLVSMLVIATKLFYSPDDIERYAMSPTDLGAIKLDWNAWRTAWQLGESVTRRAQNKASKAATVQESDVLNMSDEETDDYLDWFEKTWVDEGLNKGGKRPLPQELFDMFPISREGAPKEVPRVTEDERRETDVERIQIVQQNLQLREIVPEGEEVGHIKLVKRLGDDFAQFHEASELTDIALEFHKAVAQVANISLELLVKSVIKVEKRLERWQNQNLTAVAEAMREGPLHEAEEAEENERAINEAGEGGS